MTPMLKQYLDTALWSSLDDSDVPLDYNYTIDDIHPDSIKLADEIVDEFVTKAGPLLDDLDDGQVGHDLWLTQARHGAGFWGRGYTKEQGDALTAIAHLLADCYLYIGDDGKVHIA